MDYVEKDNPDFRTFPLPLARIKKVMKSDEEVKVGVIAFLFNLEVMGISRGSRR